MIGLAILFERISSLVSSNMRTVQRLEEMIRLQEVGNAVESVVVEENGAE